MGPDKIWTMKARIQEPHNLASPSAFPDLSLTVHPTFCLTELTVPLQQVAFAQGVCLGLASLPVRKQLKCHLSSLISPQGRQLLPPMVPVTYSYLWTSTIWGYWAGILVCLVSCLTVPGTSTYWWVDEGKDWRDSSV